MLKVIRLALALGFLAVALPSPASAQESDLDAFMQQVLDRRDDNWKKLQQYVLDEHEESELIGPAGFRLWGDRRDYTWFIRNGVFVRSPVRANGVTVSEEDRRKYEDDFARRAQEREKEAEDKDDVGAEKDRPSDRAPASTEAILTGARQPQFIDSAYFLRFKFEPGRYALVGKETLEGRDVLRIEYYPERLFSHEQDDQDERREEKRQDPSEDIEASTERMMNKVSLVTLWVEPKAHQILKYTFDNVELDFLPAAWLVRVTDARATMTMSEPFPDVWLPRGVEMQFGAMLAIGNVDFQYRVGYHDYREAATSGRLVGAGGAMKLAIAAVVAGSLLALPAAAQEAPSPAAAAAAPAVPLATEVIAVIQVHGNNATPEADVLSLVGVAPGDPFTATTLADVRDRLMRTGRFENVDVRKRFASIADLARIALVIVVDEHPVRVELPGIPGGPPRLVRRGLLGRAMFMPILDGEDGYGLTYGGRIAYVGIAGERSRLSFPLSWGGRKQAGVEFERVLRRGTISRASIGASIDRRTNPAFDEDDDRRHVWGRIERNLSDVQVGATVGWQDVSFADEGGRFTSFGADATLDTRVDPALPRNAVYARASWTHLMGEASGAIDRTTLDLRGYVGLIRQTVLVARVEQDTANRSLPRYFKPLLGGWSSLRGFRAGSFAGDTRVTGTLELRLPVSSPLSVAKTGFSVFVDAGKAYDKGVRFDDVRLETGVGVGAWLSATIVQAGVAVAHGRGGDTRVNVSLGLTF